MARKIIVAVAPVGPLDLQGVRNPLTPEEVADDAIACSHAGAALVHLHVRDEEGNPTGDLAAFGRTLSIIRENSDVVVQGSTGGLSTLSLEERCVALNDPRVEVASLNMGSVNMDDDVYVNTLPDIRYWAARMREAGVRPELEIFEAGMVHNVELLAAGGHLAPPFTYGFALGFRGALPARPEHVAYLRSILPAGSAWGLVHHHMEDMSLLAVAAGMGAALVRVGFEDSTYHAPGRVATTNAELVERLVLLLGRMGLEPATPHEAREMLGVPGLPAEPGRNAPTQGGRA